MAVVGLHHKTFRFQYIISLRKAGADSVPLICPRLLKARSDFRDKGFWKTLCTYNLNWRALSHAPTAGTSKERVSRRPHSCRRYAFFHDNADWTCYGSVSNKSGTHRASHSCAHSCERQGRISVQILYCKGCTHAAFPRRAPFHARTGLLSIKNVSDIPCIYRASRLCEPWHELAGLTYENTVYCRVDNSGVSDHCVFFRAVIGYLSGQSFSHRRCTCRAFHRCAISRG